MYDVLEYHAEGWHRDMIADTLELSSDQVEAAIRYIEENRGMRLWPVTRKTSSAFNRGNPPELQAKLDAGHERFLALMCRRTGLEVVSDVAWQ